MTVLRTGALFQHRLTLNMIKFQLSNERCCLHSEHVCAKSVTGDKKDCLFLIWLVPSTGFCLQLSNRKGFSVACTLIDNDIHYHSSQNVVGPRGAASPSHCRFAFITISTSNKMIHLRLRADKGTALTRAALSTLLSRTANWKITL